MKRRSLLWALFGTLLLVMAVIQFIPGPDSGSPASVEADTPARAEQVDRP